MRPILALVLSTFAFAQAPPDTDRLVEDLMREGLVPGLALSIVHNGAVIHQKGYGLRDVEQKQDKKPVPSGPPAIKSLGEMVVESEQWAAAKADSNARNTPTVRIKCSSTV